MVNRLHVSSNQLEEGLVCFGTSPYYAELIDQTFDLVKTLHKASLDVRRSGSAALDLCDIASGRCELFFECRLSPWDYAAGSLIVQEAGGRISRMDGTESPLIRGVRCWPADPQHGKITSKWKVIWSWHKESDQFGDRSN